jgi:hypothetical protein
MKKRLLRKTVASFLSAIALFASMTVSAEFYSGEYRFLGIGRIQSSSGSAPVAPTERLVLPIADVSSQAVSSSDLAVPLDRDVVINENAPGVSLVAGNYNSEESIPWSSGLASGYGEGFYGRWTARGTELTADCMGVAVPASWGYLLGRTIEVEYKGIVVRTVIDDTGDFARYGRVLDLQPGLWRYFGFETEDDWGVRTVRYRILP